MLATPVSAAAASNGRSRSRVSMAGPKKFICARRPTPRGLHSFTLELNLSTFGTH